jgi:hypothetical protein
MKISFIAENDWANVLTEYAYCLNKHSEDIEAKAICFRPHPFNYSIKHDYDLENCSGEILERARKWVDDSDVIIFGEEGHPLENKYRTIREFDALLGLDLINSNKKLCIWHPGTHYRQNYEFYNYHPLRDKIHKHLYAIDLYHLSPKNNNDEPLHTYQYYDFSIDIFINDFKNKITNSPKVILHIPSNSNVKGTSLINKCISNLTLPSDKFQYKILTKIPNSKVLDEKKKSIFYIDQVNPMGGYGVAAVEAFFRGNLVFCTIHNTSQALHKLTGGNEIPIVPLPMDKIEITNILHKYLNLSDEELINIIEAIGHWINEYYHPTNIIKHFNKIINE